MILNPCESSKIISGKIADFISNVRDVKEESITDYFVWQWRKLDDRFKCSRVTTFTRQQEHSETGSDFELELWLLGPASYLSIAFQAKKFFKPFDSYISKLNYPQGSQYQLKTLMKYAAQKNRCPFYMAYCAPESQTQTKPRLVDIGESGLFIIDVSTIKNYADGNFGQRVSREAILRNSYPFDWLFCQSLSNLKERLTAEFSTFGDSEKVGRRELLPSYVKHVLGGQENIVITDDQPSLRTDGTAMYPRIVGVYDLSDKP